MCPYGHTLPGAHTLVDVHAGYSIYRSRKGDKEFAAAWVEPVCAAAVPCVADATVQGTWDVRSDQIRSLPALSSALLISLRATKQATQDQGGEHAVHAYDASKTRAAIPNPRRCQHP